MARTHANIGDLHTQISIQLFLYFQIKELNQKIWIEAWSFGFQSKFHRFLRLMKNSEVRNQVPDTEEDNKTEWKVEAYIFQNEIWRL